MRYRYILVFPLALACSRSPSGQVSSDTSVGTGVLSDESVRRELTLTEDEWENALKAHDAAFFERTMSDDFVGTTVDGISDKSTLVRLNADTSVTVDSIGRSDEKIRIYGNGTVGVITGRFAERGHLGSRHLGIEFRYTEVWVKRNGRWQVVAGHYTPVEQAKKK
ncbi:MAG TPA: nuclear transport factor 2 family protein [Gemmatimonadales bacterium]|jgi:ketosteroid isomerase-like protein|nr:nuclear transport factor 2 family protein [Gemmatimonadales bacterium]